MTAYAHGQPVRLTLDTFGDAARTNPDDPTAATIDIVGPDGVPASHAWPDGNLVRDDIGKFHYDAVEEPGHYAFHGEATGAVATACDGSFDVSPKYAQPSVPTVPLSYATTADLANWLGTGGPANAVVLLRSASILVAAAANRDPYNDIPDATAAPVLRDATTAQAAAWIASDIDPAKLGIDAAPIKGRKLGPADITYDTAGQDAARREAATTLAPEARQILYTGGLLALLVPVGADPCDPLDRFGLSAGRDPFFTLWWRNL